MKTKTAMEYTVPVEGRDHIQGSIHAPITLLEYGDFECPHCAATYPILKAIQQQLGDNLCFAYRNFPLANVHPHAEQAAQAAEAAAAQDSYWEMHDLLFENQDALDIASLQRYAQALRLNTKSFIDELLAGIYSPRVREDFVYGIRGGVNGTPTLFINGSRYDGVPNVEDLLTVMASAVRAR